MLSWILKCGSVSAMLSSTISRMGEWFIFGGRLHTFLTLYSGLTSFGSIMYTSFGFDSYQTLLFGLPRSAISLGLFLIIGIYIRRVQNRRMYIMMFGCVTPFIGLLAMSLLPNSVEYKWTKWGLYVMTMPFVFPIFLAWSLRKFSLFLFPASSQ